jgi:hypothetical protein
MTMQCNKHSMYLRSDLIVAAPVCLWRKRMV